MNKHYAYNSPFKMKDADGNEYTLTVEYDECAMDPREWDNVCTMVCWHRSYRLGDRHKYDDSDEFFNDLLYRICGMHPDDYEDLPTRDKYKLACESDKLVIKPINMYEHSGITVSTSNGYPYNDRWDAGCVGFIYVTKEQVLAQLHGVAEEHWKNLANNIIENEMETYDQYVRGEVYWYRLTKKVIEQDLCPHCGEVIREYEEEEEIDACGGFYGDCLEENGILHSLPNDIEFAED